MSDAERVLRLLTNASKGRPKHGESWPGKSPEYTSWGDMRARVLNANCPAFASYGGRGVTICERWNDFANFLADMGRRPIGTTLDRIDTFGNYEPGNCRWADAHTQRTNQRPHTFCRRGHPYVTRRGENFCLTCHARRGRDRRARLTRERLSLRGVTPGCWCQAGSLESKVHTA